MAKPRNPAELPRRLPVVPLRSTVIYPTAVSGVQLGAPENLEVLARNPEEPLLVVVVPTSGEPDDPVDPRALSKIGVLARLSDRLNLPGGTVQTTMQGIRRVRLSRVEKDGHFIGRAEAVDEVPAPQEVAEELIGTILTVLEALSFEVERVSREIAAILRMNVVDPGRFADLVATLTNFSMRAKDEVLQILDVEERLRYVLAELEGQVRRVREIEDAEEAERTDEEGEPSSPEATANALRRRIRLMRAELGEIDPVEHEATQLLRRIETTALPTRVAAEGRRQVEHLRQVHPASAEAAEIRTYIDWLLHLPWYAGSHPPLAEVDLEELQQGLDSSLLGLQEPKERLLDYMAVAKLRGDLRGPVPCLVGPPEVGKRSLADALARGLNRPLARIEVPGRDEAELAGERRAKRGAGPGKFTEALRDLGVRDPLLLLEDVDLVGRGADGDPAEVLEQVLSWDGARGRFMDRYLDLPVDLSGCLFIATAQDFYRIPRDLRDLMVEIRIAGYTPEEKVAIVRSHLLPRLVEEHGLTADDVSFEESALYFLASSYARDAGVGLMRRMLATLLRTRARAKAAGSDAGTWDFTPERIEEILGLPRYIATVAESTPEVGVVTGLAWTAAGGELMFIEALRMPGEGRLIITGLLGDVMRESVNAAYSWVRSRGSHVGIDEDVFKQSDVHVHFPVGAIPKDGPSAGIAVTLALASSLSGRPVRHDLAMTGEVTLRGKVLEIGGVKEKVLAAYRAGIFEVILPAGNERDLREVPDDVREKIRFHFVERMEEVLDTALLSDEVTLRKRARRSEQDRKAERETKTDEGERKPEPRAARPKE
ncbi:MAG TPA: endopeptidase La [Longimicrobiales bacterium]|nr:endopeptidase La [Longimicrobiales bacterium]